MSTVKCAEYTRLFFGCRQTSGEHHHHLCSGCPHQHILTIQRKESRSSNDDLRLEAIRHQILTKLGLRNRPDINRTLTQIPRYLALETLYRAETPSTIRNINQNHHESGYSDYYFSYPYRQVDDIPNVTFDNIQSSTSHNSKTNQDIEIDDFYARTSEIISFAEAGKTLNGQPLLEFPISNNGAILQPIKVKKAILWGKVERKYSYHYQRHPRQRIQKNITLWVFRVRCENVTHLRGKELDKHLEMITSLSVNGNRLGWQRFDVTTFVNSWYMLQEESRSRLTLLIDCTGCASNIYVYTFGKKSHIKKSSVNIKSAIQDQNRPFLVVRLDSSGIKRVKRTAIDCNAADKGLCCKEKFYVSFAKLGWDDWIIAPQGYYANYCRGECTIGYRTPDTFLNYYTHVMDEYKKIDKLAGMQPCCAPVKFSSMSLIYYGPDSNIIKRDLPKMVVDECGCP
ncbi:hypothetical protein HCN44_009087 [Aphidius gifuensis]|uniref:TGF-beta family profile domain-containing protein n=1 Tax=Aphidius gifuensis TaxID=684658 RepID=A0A834XPA6_APHGI|nr:hypothetical protein HCN44_009087 [Aphidius gifuensis]